ncbi:MAG TPA: hypothetical protein VIQ02_00705, partial [Jiangellaceae bacterium]
GGVGWPAMASHTAATIDEISASVESFVMPCAHSMLVNEWVYICGERATWDARLTRMGWFGV